MEFYTVLKAFSLERKNSKKLESRILFPNIFLFFLSRKIIVIYKLAL